MGEEGRGGGQRQCPAPLLAGYTTGTRGTATGTTSDIGASGPSHAHPPLYSGQHNHHLPSPLGVRIVCPPNAKPHSICTLLQFACVCGDVVYAHVRNMRNFCTIFTLIFCICANIFTVACNRASTHCHKQPWWCPHLLFPPLADSKTLHKDIYIVGVTKCRLVGPASQLLHSHRLLSTHGPLGDIPPLSTEAVIVGVVVHHNLHT